MQYRLKVFHKKAEVGVPELAKFYSENNSDFNRERNPFDFIDAINSKSIFSIVDNDGLPQGVSISLRYHEDKIVEFGAVRVLLNGFGLQTILHDMQILYCYLYKIGEYIFAITDVKNEGSKKSLQRSGLEYFSPDDEFLKIIDYREKHNNNKVYLEIDNRKFDAIARDAFCRLLKLDTDGYIEKNNKILKIFIDDPIFRLPTLRDRAIKNFSCI
ncbi:hypothetical protein [Roseibium alexandrii]|uniref:hypothetical protein n=1 Tax=Roseibium alexandrii TaxID=388408 RepID=UPI0037514931